MDISIGELSRRAGVKVPTIRYYEQVGLMPLPSRSEGKQRRYGEAEAARLNFIRHARELGFEVEAIRQLLSLGADPHQPCQDADRIARAHLLDIESKITRLKALRAEVKRMIDQCAHGELKDCRVIEVLGDHGLCLSEKH